MSEELMDGTILYWYDWMLPWRAIKVIRTYACFVALEKTKYGVLAAKSQLDLAIAKQEKVTASLEPIEEILMKYKL